MNPLNLYNNFKKDQLCKEMIVIYESLQDQGESRAKYSNDWSGLGTAILALVQSESPKNVEAFKRFDEYCKAIALSESKLSQAEIRNAEDFRDVYERFAVVYRANTEYNSATSAFQSSLEKLGKARSTKENEKNNPKYPQMEAKLDATIEQCRVAAEAALANRRAKLREFIIQKEKYSTFKIKRLTHGWTTYAMALKTAMDEEIQIFNEMRDYIQQLSSGNIITPSQASTISNMVSTEYDSRPGPAKLRIIDDSPAPVPLDIPEQYTNPEPILGSESNEAEPAIPDLYNSTEVNDQEAEPASPEVYEPEEPVEPEVYQSPETTGENDTFDPDAEPEPTLPEVYEPEEPAEPEVYQAPETTGENDTFEPDAEPEASDKNPWDPYSGPLNDDGFGNFGEG